MTLTRKFYSRYREALKHGAAVLFTQISYSRTAHATEAVTVRLEGRGGQVQVLKMSAIDAGNLGERLYHYAAEDRAARGEIR